VHAVKIVMSVLLELTESFCILFIERRGHKGVHITSTTAFLFDTIYCVLDESSFNATSFSMVPTHALTNPKTSSMLLRERRLNFPWCPLPVIVEVPSE
jgi:hypothetical protein